MNCLSCNKHWSIKPFFQVTFLYTLYRLDLNCKVRISLPYTGRELLHRKILVSILYVTACRDPLKGLQVEFLTSGKVKETEQAYPQYLLHRHTTPNLVLMYMINKQWIHCREWIDTGKNWYKWVHIKNDIKVQYL